MRKGKEQTLGELVRFKAGTNASRIDADLRDRTYTSADLLGDLAQIEGESRLPIPPQPLETVRKGDIVLDLLSGKAAVATAASCNRILRNTMARCDILGDVLDPWYLCYLFNESNELREAREAGIVASSRFLTIAGLQKLILYVPPIDRQEKIGKVYRDFCRLARLRQERESLFGRIVLETIKRENGGI
jgi:hypothetical protein